MPSDSIPQAGAAGNLFLDSLSAASAAIVLPKLHRVTLSNGAVIAHAGSPIDHVFFPVSSVISSVTRMRDGTDIEVVLVGWDRFFGLQLALEDAISSSEAMVQTPDSFWKMNSGDFLECLRSDAALKQRTLSYTQVTLETIAQLSGCNRLHPINERCARWLLMAHDRVDCDAILLTHEYLATTLGVRRPGVSLAAAALEEAGLIDYHRGRIVVRNRRGLEVVAYACYGAINDSMDRLLGYDVRKRAKNGHRRRLCSIPNCANNVAAL